MKNVKKYIFKQVSENKLSTIEAKELLKELNTEKEEDIAIIGMACRFPNAKDIHEYWNNIKNGVNCFLKFPDNRKKYVSPIHDNPHFAEFLSGSSLTEDEKTMLFDGKAGYLEDVDKFDAAFFNIPPREAKYIDPIQRVFLETAWSAVEDAGYGGKKIYGSNTGVYVGRDYTGSTFYKWLVEIDPMLYTGTWEGILASRISYIFNLRGPAMVIDTACSSGLVSIHNACQALKNKECDMAIAGGIALGSTPQTTIDDEESSKSVLNSVKSEDNLVKTFDKRSTGTIFGEGVGAVILKPMSKAIADGDNIYAVIKGSAVNNDGASNGIAAPNPEAQQELLCKAWENAKIEPETIGYIEAHGTGTLLGDPIEIKGLTSAFRKYTNKNQICGIGSVKTNMGHLVAASGVAALIKVVSSLKDKKLPPTINFSAPNDHINFVESPLYVSDMLKDWESKEFPRRAGVSAFGFSGTNCHIVLEEAPTTTIEDEVIKKESKPQVIAISARCVESLRELIDKYSKFLNTRDELRLDDICYTANTGRSHLDYRLILIVDNLEDLKDKICNINNSGMKNIRNVFYSQHSVVSDKKRVREVGEISESERRQLDAEAKEIISKITSSEVSGYLDNLNKLAELYIKGANVNWESLYKNETRKRVSIPGYQYEKKAYWGEIKQSKLKGNINVKNIEHPFLDTLVVSSFTQDIYLVKFSINSHWVLKDHKILGKHIIPGTAYTEMFRYIGERYYGDSRLQLKDLIFYTPLAVEKDEVKEVQIVVSKENSYLKVVVANKDTSLTEVDGNWVKHAECKISILDEAEVKDNTTIDELSKREDLEELTLNFSLLSDETSNLVTFGPRWFNVKRAAKGEKELFVSLELPDEFKDDLKTYNIHPAMLDNAINIGINNFGDGVYLPLSYGSLKLFDKMPRKFYSHLRLREKNSSSLETLEFDIFLINENNEVFAYIEQYIVKKAKQIVDYVGRFNTYFKTDWIREDLKEESIGTKQGNIMILKDKAGLADNLVATFKKSGKEVYEVELGEYFSKEDNNKFIIDGTEESYFKLTKEVSEKGITQVVHMFTLNGDKRILSLQDLKEQKLRGLDSIFYLTRALVSNKINDKLDLTLISDYVKEVSKEEDTINPHNSAFFGFAKAIPFEYSNISCKTIDIDHSTDITNISQEMTSTKQVLRVAYRNNKRYIEELSKVSMETITNIQTDIKEDGVYVITGGTGGIGLEIAKYIASKNRIKLCLINRSQLPAMEEWKDLVEQDKDKKLTNKLKALMELNSLGSEVTCLVADVSNENELRDAITSIREKYGKINGVIHCAGLPGDGFIIRKDKNVFDKVVAPKYEGTWLIDNLTSNDNLDFFVMCSSMESLLGGAGQGDYTAANSYIDSFSAYRNKLGKRTISINWTAWTETGMATDFGVDSEEALQGMLFKPVNNNQGIAIFDEILNSNLTNIITGDMNYNLAASIEIKKYIQVSKEVKILIEKAANAIKNVDSPKSKKVAVEVQITGKSSDEYTQFEKTLAIIYATVLDISEIDIFDSFYDMGGDSIMAMELLVTIDSQYPNVVDITDIFSRSSVVDMAEYIQIKMEIPEKNIIIEDKTNELEEELKDMVNKS
ncbi:MAG: beta-ketoacyl synthase family proteinphosphopantetheine-containing protein [Clostridiaceae bacterium]|nr:beta-ketoacyl synthase family proteinphosphopantetheine-containing protein [Clostridiaceae bacterium]